MEIIKHAKFWRISIETLEELHRNNLMKYSKWKRITLLKIVCSKWCKGLRILIYDNKEACKVGGDGCTNICYGQNENSMSSPERWENLYRIFKVGLYNVSVLLLDIQLSRKESWDPWHINFCDGLKPGQRFLSAYCVH